MSKKKKSVWQVVKSWGKGILDGALDFITFGAVSQAAQEANEEKYEIARNEAKAILNKLDADQINLNQLKDALLNKKSNVLNSILSSSPFGKQYEEMKKQVKQIDDDIQQTDHISKGINSQYKKASDALDEVNKMETESGLINQISNQPPKVQYDRSYSEQLSDMADRIKQ